MSPGFDDHRLLTAEDLALEPDDNLRRELYDGVMHVSPPADEAHTWAVKAVDSTLHANAPDDVYIFLTIGVHTGLRRFHVPDVTVVWQRTRFHTFGYDRSGVLLAVEVVSPGSLVMDRVAKPAIYARAGIPWFWRIDTGPVLQSYLLDEATGEYALAVELGPGERGSPAAPWPVTIDMAQLVLPEER